METEIILKMAGIHKSFLRVEANRGIDFELYRGEICSLLGENGAGKSTLMNILYGLYHPDEGRIFLEGKEVRIDSPKDAIRLGIGMVHQHFNLVPPHQVWENIVIGTEHLFILNRRQACQEIANISNHFGLKVNPEAYIWQLSVGEKQKVEIIKVLFRGARILILDEPTSVLTPQEADSLFSTLKKMVKRGLSIIFISHKLKEVLSVADRVVVLRGGRVVGSVPTNEIDMGELASLMVGGEESFGVRSEVRAPGNREVLRVEKLLVESDMGHQALKGVSFSIFEGEILGLAGVSGNGQRELAEVLSGTRKPTQGTTYFLGKPLLSLSTSFLVRSGWGRIPEDRMGDGVILNLNLMENLLLENHSHPEFRRGPFLNFRRAKEYARVLIQDYDIRPPVIDIPAHNLSGGNLQKLILARELSRKPRMIIAAQPTRGLDVKALDYVQNLLLEEKGKGAAILLISEDLDEIMELSDRIAVIYEGEILKIVKNEEVSRSQIGLMMAGIR
jgi:simple sugar transport system ATP-binding protein